MKLFKPDIKKLHKNNNFNELLKCLDHKNAGIRYSAFVALADRTDEDTAITSRLKKMITDADPRVRTIAALKFAGPGDPSVSKIMMEIINEGTQNDKIELLRIISGLGQSNDETVLQVVMTGLTDKKETVKLQAIKAAGKLKSSHLIPYLGELLNAKHHKIRYFTAGALFDTGGEEVTDYLIGLLADKDEEVRGAARAYLEKSTFPYAHEAIYNAVFMQLITGMNDKEPVRKATAQKIGHERIREGLPLLYRACRDKYRDVRIEALKAIASFGSQNSIETVSKLLDDKFHEVRLEALNTLGTIGGLKSLKAAERCLNDKSKDVSKHAENTVAKIRRSLQQMPG